MLQPRQLPGIELHFEVHTAPDTLIPRCTLPSPCMCKPLTVVHSPHVDNLVDLSLRLTTGFARKCAFSLFAC